MTQRHLLLIDSSSFAYRAHFTPSADLRTKDGLPIKAVIGFCSMVWRMLGRAGEGDPPTYAAAAFDAPGKTFRHKLFKDYKGQRKRPEDLAEQIPIMKEAADLLGLKPIEASGFEADDVIATLAHTARHARIRTTIVSIDKDFCQLVEDDRVEIVDPFNRKRTGVGEVVTKFGVPPVFVPQLQALCGDAVDNIPGVQGIGLQKGAELLLRFGSLDGVIKALDRPHSFTPAIFRALKAEQKNLLKYLNLATLRSNVPLPVGMDWADLAPKTPSRVALRTFLAGLDCADSVDRVFPEWKGQGGRIVFRLVDPMPADKSFTWWAAERSRPGGQVVPDTPQCGFYRRKLVKGGHWVPVRIWREPDKDRVTGHVSGMEKLCCEVNGERVDPNSQWGYVCANPISEVEFKKLGTVKDPRQPIDHMKTPIE